MVDATKRPLQIPPWHIPYLDKHRIYELFHEIARELVIQQPEDHLAFMKQILLNAAELRDTSRVILICSQRINVLEVARLISLNTKQIVITEKSILDMVQKSDRSELTPAMLIKALTFVTKKNSAYRLGWIMVNCIRNEEDARILLKAGILPTHVLHLIPPFYPSVNELLYCHVPTEWPNHRRQIFGLRVAFHKVLKEVYLQDRDIHDVVVDCINIINIKGGIAPIVPRILILGPRGCGRKTQAKMLAERLGLIYINFEYLLCQYWISDTDLGKIMRACTDEVCVHSELMVQIINKRLLELDCLTKGYVLTHFPYTDQDFKWLDSIDTPPNRVIFLEADINMCKDRVQNRRVHIYDGTVIHIDKNEAFQEKLDEYRVHPKDQPDVVEAEINFYCNQLGNLRKYCGNTANIVNADQPEMRVYECITAIITRTAPVAAPRTGLEGMPSSSLFSEALEGSSQDVSCCCRPIPLKIWDCYVNEFVKKHRS